MGRGKPKCAGSGSEVAAKLLSSNTVVASADASAEPNRITAETLTIATPTTGYFWRTRRKGLGIAIL